ncbi:MAG: alpha/beta fold hydrolase [Acidobacteriota bacterium]
MLRRLWLGTSTAHLADAQEALLRRFLPSELFETGRVRTFKSHGLNAVELLPKDGGQHARTVVLAHGYGNGLGFYFRNLADLAALPGTRVLAFDWLGWGLSDRPPCRGTPRRVTSFSFCTSKFNDPATAEEFFIDSFEQWRQEAMAPEEPFLLCGHSLGGFLSAKWALRHGARASSGLRSLVLLSPVGLPAHPADAISFREAPSNGGKRSRLLPLVDCLWSRNFTPQMVLRAMGPRAWPWTLRSVRRRFRDVGLSEDDSTLLARYLFHLSVAPASGEYALNSVLQPLLSESAGPQVFARLPLAGRLGPELPPNLPIEILFGDSDWLATKVTLETAEELQVERRDTARVSIVPTAGHYLHLENPKAILAVLEDQLERM